MARKWTLAILVDFAGVNKDHSMGMMINSDDYLKLRVSKSVFTTKQTVI